MGFNHVAQSGIPEDSPQHFKAVKTEGDGNCLCHALSKAFFNEDTKHLEIRVRIIIEAILHKEKYLTLGAPVETVVSFHKKYLSTAENCCREATKAADTSTCVLHSSTPIIN